MKIAFLGLGNMGYHMARNLAAAGHQVTGFDVVPAALTRAEEAGIAIASDAAQAVSEAETVITMLPTGRHVLDAYRGDAGTTGLLAAAAPGTLFIDSSTISVAESRTAAELAVAAGHRCVDAPVSGGVAGAEAGTLTFMVGGAAENVAAAHQLFEVMGSKIVHCGGAGSGQAAKVCNNMLLAITTIGAAEAFTLGHNLGLTDQALYDVLSTSAAQCWAVTTNCPVPGPVPTAPASRGYAPGFATALMAKDLGLAHQAIADTGTPASFGEAAFEAYTQFNNANDGENSGKDFSAIIQTLREEVEHS